VADANAWLTVEESKILRGTWVPLAGSALTVAGLADRWLASNPIKRDSSRSRDASTVMHYIKPVIRDLKVAALTKVTLRGLVDNRTAVDHLAASTVHRMASTLHALFQHAVDDKKRLDNPADDRKLPGAAQGD
jgi:site-specific recombinase XerD